MIDIAGPREGKMVPRSCLILTVSHHGGRLCLSLPLTEISIKQTKARISEEEEGAAA